MVWYDIDSLHLRLVLTRKGKELSRYIFAASYRLHSLGQILFLFRRYRSVKGGQFREPGNDSQYVIEVMGNASGEGSNGFHFLDLLESRFQFLAFLLSSYTLREIERNISQETRFARLSIFDCEDHRRERP